MNKETRQRKHAGTIFKALRGQEWLAGHVAQILETGKESLDRFLLELGGMRMKGQIWNGQRGRRRSA